LIWINCTAVQVRIIEHSVPASGAVPNDLGETTIELYVLPLRQLDAVVWMICKASPSNCVGIQEDVDQAKAQAIRMAEYGLLAGVPTQVHWQESPGAPWQTIWCSPDAVPRFDYSRVPSP
jgi:hypothetical protein